MVLSVFAPIGMVGADAGTADRAPVDAAEYTDRSLDSEPATIHDNLQSADGTVEVVLRLETVEDDALAASHDEIGTMQAHARSTQQPIQQYAATTPGVDLERGFWLSNAILATVDTDWVSLDELARLEGVTEIHENYAVSLVEGADGDAVDRPTGSERTADSTLSASTDDRDGGSIDGTVQEGSNWETTYGLEQINAPDVWDEFEVRGEGTKIAVLDTGVDPTHPDIDLYTADPTDPTHPGGWAEIDANGEPIEGSEPYDSHTHGTHVSGTVAGGNESGEYIGVAPGADLMHGLVLEDGFGTWAQVVGGMEWAVDNDADVISMSLGWSEEYRAEFIQPIRDAQAAGTTVVSASGNDGVDTSGSPANVYDGLAIGATDESKDVASFSSGETIDTEDAWGDDAKDDWPETYTVPDVAAPGVGVTSAMPGGGYEPQSGTSMAAPHVSGTIGLMLSAGADRDAAELSAALSETAWLPDDETDQETRYGDGIVDSLAATDAVSPGSGVEGVVTDGNGDPIADAAVTVDDRQVQTDDDGSYLVYVDSGTHTLTVDAFGYETNESEVTVEDDAFTVANRTLEDELDATVVTGQPDVLEGGESFSTALRLANAETLSVEAGGDYDPGDATLTVDDTDYEFGDEIDVGGQDSATVTVGTTNETSGTLELNHTVTAGDDTVSLETGPTTVFEDVTQVAVVDDNDQYGSNVATALLDQLPANSRAEVVSSETAIDAVEDDTYDAYVIQFLDENTHEFVSETAAADVGVVYLDQLSADSNGITRFASAADEVDDFEGTSNQAPPVSYDVHGEHRLLEDWATDETVEISNERWGDHVWFELADDSSFEVVADVADGTGTAGSAFAIDDETNTVLAASLGRTQFVTNNDYTDDADAILADAVTHLVSATDRSAELYGTAEIDGERAEEGATVTATVGGEPQATATVDADGVYATEDDPLTVDGADFGANDTITFTVDGLAADETAGWTVQTDPDELNLTVTEGDLEGTITEATHGDPIPDATVELVKSDGDGDGATVMTDDNGSYVFENRTPAAYDLEVHAGGFEDGTLTEIPVSSGPTDDSLTENVSLAGDARIDGAVTDGEDPIDATVTADGPYGPFETTSDAGAYDLEGVPGTGEEYTVEAAAPNYESEAHSAVLDAGATETIDFDLEPTTVQLELDGTNSPVDAGETLEVNVTVMNTGDEQLNRTIGLEIGDETIDTRELTLEGDESAPVSLAWETVGDDIGEHDAVVAIDDTELSERVRVDEPDLPAIELSHSPGPGGSADGFHAEHLAVEADERLELGGDAGFDFEITDVDTDESVTVSPTEDAALRDGELFVPLLYETTGTVYDDPLVHVIGSGESGPVEVSVSGDTDMFQAETFSSYVVSVVDRDSELTVAETDGRLVGIGYEATLEQDSTTDDVTVSIPRDEGVDEDWDATFRLLELEDGSPGELVDWSELDNEASAESFETTLDTSSLEPDDYGWTVELTGNRHTANQIIQLRGWNEENAVVVNETTAPPPPPAPQPEPEPDATDDPAAFHLEDLDAPTTVETGDDVPVDAVIRNVGDESGDTDVVVSIDGTIAAETGITVDAGASEPVSFVVAAPGSPGEYELTVETDDDEYATGLVVVAADDESEAEANDEGDDDVVAEFGDGQPGFGVPAAVVALLVAVAIARVRFE